VCDERDVTNEIENACDGGRVPWCKSRISEFGTWSQMEPLFFGDYRIPYNSNTV